jgi:hypothetical protein
MAETVSQMTPTELRELIEDAVESKIVELVGDPDSGLELREEIRDRLEAQQREVATGRLGEPFEVVVKRLGLQ